MEYIAHRINTIQELNKIPTEYGVELDLRDYGNKLILQHDPFIKGEEFEEYLKHYNHGTMILNIKSERVENRILELLKKYNVKKYFFLDSSFPMIYLMSKTGEKNIALRYSEIEGIDTLMKMKGRVEWVWVDCFTRFPLELESYNILKEHFKLCLVSPELQKHSLNLIKEYSLKLIQMPFDSVCTKRPDIWQQFLK
jgi:hypothetical protein